METVNANSLDEDARMAQRLHEELNGNVQMHTIGQQICATRIEHEQEQQQQQQIEHEQELDDDIALAKKLHEELNFCEQADEALAKKLQEEMRAEEDLKATLDMELAEKMQKELDLEEMTRNLEIEMKDLELALKLQQKENNTWKRADQSVLCNFSTKSSGSKDARLNESNANETENETENEIDYHNNTFYEMHDLLEELLAQKQCNATDASYLRRNASEIAKKLHLVGDPKRRQTLGQEMRQCNEQAARIIFSAQNKQLVDLVHQFRDSGKRRAFCDSFSLKVDIHYLMLHEAKSRLPAVIEFLSVVRGISSFQLICGKGKHSLNNNARLRPQIKQFLSKMNQSGRINTYREVSTGTFQIWLLESG